MSSEDYILQISEEGNTGELKKLLEGGGANIHRTDENGNTALMLAAMNNHAEAVKMLLEAGSFFHTTNRHGHNAVIIAAMLCNEEAVQVLLDHTKKVTDRKSPSIVALMCASSIESQGCFNVADMLRTTPC